MKKIKDGNKIKEEFLNIIRKKLTKKEFFKWAVYHLEKDRIQAAYMGKNKWDIDVIEEEVIRLKARMKRRRRKQKWQR